jgi:hypothetical protein
VASWWLRFVPSAVRFVVGNSIHGTVRLATVYSCPDNALRSGRSIEGSSTPKAAHREPGADLARVAGSGYWTGFQWQSFFEIATPCAEWLGCMLCLQGFSVHRTAFAGRDVDEAIDQ